MWYELCLIAIWSCAEREQELQLERDRNFLQVLEEIRASEERYNKGESET